MLNSWTINENGPSVLHQVASFTEESVTKLLFISAVAVECCITVTKDKGSYTGEICPWSYFNWPCLEPR